MKKIFRAKNGNNYILLARNYSLENMLFHPWAERQAARETCRLMEKK